MKFKTTIAAALLLITPAFAHTSVFARLRTRDVMVISPDAGIAAKKNASALFQMSAPLPLTVNWKKSVVNAPVA